jgi:hypothetical protein
VPVEIDRAHFEATVGREPPSGREVRGRRGQPVTIGADPAGWQTSSPVAIIFLAPGDRSGSPGPRLDARRRQ